MRKTTGVGLLSFVLILPSVALANKPSIRSAVPDYSNGTLFIAGSNFGPSPSVAIDRMRVTIISYSDSLLLVQVPASVIATPGTYLVRVWSDKDESDNDHSATFVVTFGTIGPKGDKGDTGPQGATGPKGPAGTLRSPQANVRGYTNGDDCCVHVS